MKKSWFTALKDHMKFSRSERSERDDSSSAAAKDKNRELHGWKCMPYIVGNETFEKLASMGLTANFTIYLTEKYHMSQVTAAQYSNVFGGSSNLAPIVGAFISDAYLGRFRTLAWGSIASVLGMILLTMTAAISHLTPPNCISNPETLVSCQEASKSQIAFLILSLIMITLGAGGVRPCSLPFGVDQFDCTSEQGRLSLNSFFNWYYFTSTVGSLLSLTVLVYVQERVSWAVGYGIPTVLMVISVGFLFSGMRLYYYIPPESSVFSGIAQVFVAAFRKRNLHLSAADDLLHQESLLYNLFTRSDRIAKLPLTLQLRCLNKAAIVCEGELEEDGTIAEPWRLCTVQQIEEVKCLVRIIPIWASGVLCYLALSQLWTFTVFQAITMERHIGSGFEVPPATIGNITLLALTLFIPIYDQGIVRVARRFTGLESGITVLQRQGVGIVMSALAMVVAAQVEAKRRSSAIAHGGTTPMSALWLAPQLSLMGIGEALNAVGHIEFYNRQFPDHMHTVAGAMFYCSLGGSSYLSGILVAVVQKNTNWLTNNDINTGRLDYFYYVIAAIGGVGFIYFLVCAHFYKYKEPPVRRKYGSSEETRSLIC